jgi:hypothetical protein
MLPLDARPLGRVDAASMDVTVLETVVVTAPVTDRHFARSM